MPLPMTAGNFTSAVAIMEQKARAIVLKTIFFICILF